MQYRPSRWDKVTILQTIPVMRNLAFCELHMCNYEKKTGPPAYRDSAGTAKSVTVAGVSLYQTIFSIRLFFLGPTNCATGLPAYSDTG